MSERKPLIKVQTYEGSYDEIKANRRKKTLQRIDEKYTRCQNCGLITDKTKSGKCRHCGFRWVQDGN